MHLLYTAGTDYVSTNQQFILDSSVTTTQVCLPVITLEDEFVEELETISIIATEVSGGISISGSPVSLQIHSREGMYIIYPFIKE